MPTSVKQLMEAANLIENEKVQVLNVNNGERQESMGADDGEQADSHAEVSHNQVINVLEEEEQSRRELPEAQSEASRWGRPTEQGLVRRPLVANRFHQCGVHLDSCCGS